MSAGRRHVGGLISSRSRFLGEYGRYSGIHLFSEGLHKVGDLEVLCAYLLAGFATDTC